MCALRPCLTPGSHAPHSPTIPLTASHPPFPPSIPRPPPLPPAHTGEVYDPPLTRPVPLATPHPLLNSPLAPFLAAFDAAAPPPTAAAAAAATNGTNQPTASAQLVRVMPAHAHAHAHTNTQGRQPYSPYQFAFTAAPLAPAVPDGYRCGAHALYLAYLMRRGGGRSARGLLGMVLGQSHRRRAAVRWGTWVEVGGGGGGARRRWGWEEVLGLGGGGGARRWEEVVGLGGGGEAWRWWALAGGGAAVEGFGWRLMQNGAEGPVT